MAKKIDVYGELNSRTGDGIIADASQIWDSTQGKFQDEINQETANDGLVSVKVEQEFTDEEKAQGRENIGAVGFVDNGAYDVTANNNNIKFVNLADLLGRQNLNTLIPTTVRKGGMSIKFVCSSDNKYVQYFLTKDEWSASEADWEKMNLEEEVIQLIGKSTEITESDVTSEAGRWDNNNGVIVTASSGLLHRASPISLSDVSSFDLTVEMDWANIPAAYICDDAGNVLESINRQSEDPTVLTGVTVPSGATKLYVNFATYFSFKHFVRGRIEEMEEDIDDLRGEIGSKIVELVSFASSSATSNVTVIGGKYYNTNTKNICTYIGDNIYDVESPAKGVIYLCQGNFYVWDGVTMIGTTEKVIPLYKFDTGAPAGISRGQYYYNTQKKKVYQNNGGSLYNSREVNPENALFIYNSVIYVWNGTELIVANYGEIQKVQDNLYKTLKDYAAISIGDNTTPMNLSESDFESGNLQGGTGAELPATNVIRTTDYIAVVPGNTITYSSANSYRVLFFEFDKNKAWKWNTNWLTGTGTHTIKEDCEYIRIVVASPSGVTTAPVWSDIELSIIPSKTYQFTRAAAESTIEEKVGEYFNIELPILAPSPQLPANNDSASDINAETMTSMRIQAAIEGILDKLLIPSKNNYPNNPRYGTVYNVIGRDASDQYDIKAYVFTKRNRFCWRKSGALYAWENGNTIVYTDHCSPLIDDVVYSNEEKTQFGVVSSYNSSTQAITVSGVQYTRADSEKIAADDIFTQAELLSDATTIAAYKKDGTSLGNATVSSSTSLSISDKTYTRYSSGDYHTENKATIVLWGNEHGPQSDPNEPSVIIYRLVKDLCSGCSDNPFISYLRGYCKIVVIPAANPYGVNIYQSGGYGRNNYNNININRNYDTVGWAVQQDTDKGVYAGDQPETQFIMNLVLDMDADIAIDIHCLGYETANNEGKCHHEGKVTELNSKVEETMSGYCGLDYSSYGSESPDTRATGADWVFTLGIAGGLIEMNAGPYSRNFDGKQHSDIIMFADYTLLLNTLRMWYYQFDSTLDLSRFSIR